MSGTGGDGRQTDGIDMAYRRLPLRELPGDDGKGVSGTHGARCPHLHDLFRAGTLLRCHQSGSQSLCVGEGEEQLLGSGGEALLAGCGGTGVYDL